MAGVDRADLKGFLWLCNAPRLPDRLPQSPWCIQWSTQTPDRAGPAQPARSRYTSARSSSNGKFPASHSRLQPRGLLARDMLSVPPQSCDVVMQDYTSCSAAARSGIAAAAAAAATAVCGNAAPQQQQQVPMSHLACGDQQQQQFGAKATRQMSDESSAALSTGVSWHAPSPASLQNTGGSASPSSGSTGAAYAAGAMPQNAVLPQLGPGAGQAWSPTNTPGPSQQQQQHAGNSSATCFLQLAAAHSSYPPGGFNQSLGNTLQQSVDRAMQHAAAGNVGSMSRSHSVPCSVSDGAYAQQGVGRTTAQQQQQLNLSPMLLARQHGSGAQLLPPLQPPQQLPVLMPLQLPQHAALQQQQSLQQLLLSSAQRRQQPRRKLVPKSPGYAPEGASTMLVLESQPSEPGFEAGFEAGLMQGLAQLTQQGLAQLSATGSTLVPAAASLLLLAAASAAPAAVGGGPGGFLTPAGSSRGLGFSPAVTLGPPVLNPSGPLGLDPAGLGLNPAGLGLCAPLVAPKPPAVPAGVSALTPSGVPASRALLQAQIAQQQRILQTALQQQQQAAQQQQQQQQQQAVLQQQVQQQAGVLSRLGLKRAPAVKRRSKRRLQEEQQPSTSTECAVDAAEAACVSASPPPADAEPMAHSPTAAAAGPAATGQAAAADAAAPKLPSATSVAMCCSISDLLGVTSREEAAMRLADMSREELFQFAAKALGSTCTPAQVAAGCCAPPQASAGCCAPPAASCTPAQRAAGCCTPAQIAAGCCAPAQVSCTPAQIAAGCCTPAQIAAGCCAPAAAGKAAACNPSLPDAAAATAPCCAPGPHTSSTAATLVRSGSGSVQYCTPEQLVEGCCTADQVAAGRCKLVQYCTPEQLAQGCCTADEVASGHCILIQYCTPEQLAQGCCTADEVASGHCILIQYCTPDQLAQGCCTADQVASGHCILVPAVTDSDTCGSAGCSKGGPAGRDESANLSRSFNRSKSWPMTRPTPQQLSAGPASCGPSESAAKRSRTSARLSAAAAAAPASNLQDPSRILPASAAAGDAAAASTQHGALQQQQLSTGAAAAAAVADCHMGEPLSYMQMYVDWQLDGDLDWPEQL